VCLKNRASTSEKGFLVDHTVMILAVVDLPVCWRSDYDDARLLNDTNDPTL